MAEISQEDANLLSCLKNLELGMITDKSSTKMTKEPNPFMRRRSKSLSSINFGTKCNNCTDKPQNIKHTTSFKRPNKKILRDPVLKFLRCTHKGSEKFSPKIPTKCKKKRDRQFGDCSSHIEQNFKSITDACESLTIGSSAANTSSINYSAPSFLSARSQNNVRVDPSNSNMGSCSHQARMNGNSPCDVTIDELASYFETFVHIPKKMSSMAEMMYI